MFMLFISSITCTILIVIFKTAIENLNTAINREEMDQDIFTSDYQFHKDAEISDSETGSVSTSTSDKKHQSWVWEHFILDENLKKPQCNYCKVHVSASKGSTTGMSKHIKSKHLLKTPKNNQLTLHEAIENIPILVS
jgi:hypothetical protein